MIVEMVQKPAFSVIGQEGTTDMGAGFVQRLWQTANERFAEVAPLAKKNPDGTPAGCWGAMSDPAMRFLPWEDGFSRGRYLAGIECADDAQAPAGWQKWSIPGFEALRIQCEDGDTFQKGLAEVEKRGLSLVYAVQDYTDLMTGKNYMLFPVRRL